MFFRFAFCIFCMGEVFCADLGIAQEKTIHVSELGRSNVIGYLGEPLGTVVRITGVCVDGDELRSKLASGKILLKVHSVNGKALATSVTFFHPYLRDQDSLPKPGTRFDYFVHETGGFYGGVDVPGNIDTLKPLKPLLPDTAFGYKKSLVLHSMRADDRVLEPPDDRKRLLEALGGGMDAGSKSKSR
ncbi:MAG: hypothetical protein AAF664_24855 [Planctomycetota bacterium]